MPLLVVISSTFKECSFYVFNPLEYSCQIYFKHIETSSCVALNCVNPSNEIIEASCFQIKGVKFQKQLLFLLSHVLPDTTVKLQMASEEMSALDIMVFFLSAEHVKK